MGWDRYTAIGSSFRRDFAAHYQFLIGAHYSVIDYMFFLFENICREYNCLCFQLLYLTWVEWCKMLVLLFFISIILLSASFVAGQEDTFLVAAPCIPPFLSTVRSRHSCKLVHRRR